MLKNLVFAFIYLYCSSTEKGLKCMRQAYCDIIQSPWFGMTTAVVITKRGSQSTSDRNSGREDDRDEPHDGFNRRKTCRGC